MIVGRPANWGVIAALLSSGAAVSATPAPHVGVAGPGVAPRAPQIMLYFSHSIGSFPGATAPKFGLKVQQVRQAGNSGDPEAAGDPMQERELVNWQMQAHSNLRFSDIRVQLGRRVTYDVTNRKFGSPSTRSALQLGAASLRNGLSNTSAPRSSLNSTASPAAANREAVSDNSNVRDLAVAAMSALAPSKFMSTPRQGAQSRGAGTRSALEEARRMQNH